MSELTHFNHSGEAHMVDVGEKEISRRVAVTEGRIRMKPRGEYRQPVRDPVTSQVPFDSLFRNVYSNSRR